MSKLFRARSLAVNRTPILTTLITDFERDALGQMLTKTSHHRHNAQPEERSRYLYDRAGRLRETYNAYQYLAFDYDRFGNLQQEHHSDLIATTHR